MGIYNIVLCNSCLSLLQRVQREATLVEQPVYCYSLMPSIYTHTHTHTHTHTKPVAHNRTTRTHARKQGIQSGTNSEIEKTIQVLNTAMYSIYGSKSTPMKVRSVSGSAAPRARVCTPTCRTLRHRER